jgi:hypothetical protein
MNGRKLFKDMESGRQRLEIPFCPKAMRFSSGRTLTVLEEARPGPECRPFFEALTSDQS